MNKFRVKSRLKFIPSVGKIPQNLVQFLQTNLDLRLALDAMHHWSSPSPSSCFLVTNCVVLSSCAFWLYTIHIYIDESSLKLLPCCARCPSCSIYKVHYDQKKEKGMWNMNLDNSGNCSSLIYFHHLKKKMVAVILLLTFKIKMLKGPILFLRWIANVKFSYYYSAINSFFFTYWLFVFLTNYQFNILIIIFIILYI